MFLCAVIRHRQEWTTRPPIHAWSPSTSSPLPCQSLCQHASWSSLCFNSIERMQSGLTLPANAWGRISRLDDELRTRQWYVVWSLWDELVVFLTPEFMMLVWEMNERPVTFKKWEENRTLCRTFDILVLKKNCFWGTTDSSGLHTHKGIFSKFALGRLLHPSPYLHFGSSIRSISFQLWQRIISKHALVFVREGPNKTEQQLFANREV